ncbi:MAG: response regulator transcription factor [Spirochaetales bacterium]|nr:response regulator transcription factor [Spirochaetales bacterium]
MAISLLLSDDHKIMRDGLKSLVEQLPDIEIAGEAVDGIETIELARSLKPDIVIMDVTMPGLNGIEATRKILEENDGIRIIALSMHSNSRFITEMLSAGASGYLIKDCAFEELASAIKTVYHDGTYLSRSITGIVINDYVRKTAKKDGCRLHSLSEREYEVLKYLADGKNPKEIAWYLNISVKTVEAHRRRIMTKLSLAGIAELVKYAIREGITSPCITCTG